jgi:hypothetical protein
VAKNSGLFSKYRLCFDFEPLWAGLHFGRVFHKHIRSPWPDYSLGKSFFETLLRPTVRFLVEGRPLRPTDVGQVLIDTCSVNWLSLIKCRLHVHISDEIDEK